MVKRKKPQVSVSITPLVSVIVPVYNRSRLIKSCVELLVRQKVDFDYELILVDDCSTDDTPSVLDSWQKRYPKLIRIITRQVNGGAGLARNTGIKEAKADIMAFTDSDCEAEPDWLDQLTRDLRSGKEMIALGKPAGLPGNIWQELQQESYNDWVRNVVHDGYAQSFDTRNCALRKEVFKKVGLLSRIRVLHDTDIGCRMLEAGYRICYVPEAVIRHFHREGFASTFRTVYNMHKEILTILARHPSWLSRNHFFIVSLGAGTLLLGLLVLMPVGVLYFPVVYLVALTTILILLTLSKLRSPHNLILWRVVFSATYGITMAIGTIAGFIKMLHEKNEKFDTI